MVLTIMFMQAQNMLLLADTQFQQINCLFNLRLATTINSMLAKLKILK